MDEEGRELLPEVLKSLVKDLRRYEARYEKRFWKKIDIPSSFPDLLGGLTKEQMKKICQSYGFKRLSALKKTDLAAKLVELVPEKFTNILHVLDQSRYRLLKAAAKKQGALRAADLETAKAEALLGSYLVFPGTCDGERVLYMPPEITDLFTRADDAGLKRTVTRNTEWINLTHGMLYYYGLMGVGALKGRIEQLTGEQIDYREFITVLVPAMEYYGQVQQTGHGFCDRRVSDAEELFYEHRSRQNIEYYPFTKKQLSRAGVPGYFDRTPAMNDILELISEIRYFDEGEKNEIVLQLIKLINRGEQPDGLFKYLGSRLEFPPFDFLELLAAEIMELYNNTRQWALKGHTPDELFQKEKEHLKPLPAEPFTAERAEPKVIDLKTRKKIGRNDPCPCGSGKKFKRCCGR